MKKIIHLTEQDVRRATREVIEEYYQSVNPEDELRKEKAFMRVHYGIYGNLSGPQPLTETYVDRIVNKHGAAGLAIISANNSEIGDNAINNANTKRLRGDIRRTGRSYIPVYGGYHDKNNDVVDSYEPSFIVTNYDRQGNKMDFQDLFDFAISMCKKYNQDSVCIKGEGDTPPHFYDKNGEMVSDKNKDTTKVVKNDPTQEFFTSLIKTRRLDKEHPERSKRFTYDIHFPDDVKDDEEKVFECFVNPNPATLNERRRRRMSGEILFC